MSNIAILGQAEEMSEYIAELERSGHQMHFIDADFSVSEFQQMEAVILFYNDQQDIEQMYERIIDIRKKHFNVYIFILANEIRKVHHVVFLQLGCDCIFNADMGEDAFALSISNFVRRPTPKNILNQIDAEKEDEYPADIQLVPNNFSVILEGDREVSLTRLEFRALDYLVLRRGEAVTYEELYSYMWNKKGTCKNYRVSNVIFHLREKIEEDASNPKYIANVRAQGYLLKL